MMILNFGRMNGLLAFVVALFAFGSCRTLLAADSSLPLPDALKNIPAAQSACHAKNGNIESNADNPPEEVADLSCAMSVSELTSIDSPQLFVVDVRASNEFNASHIPDSVNLSPSDLLSKPYWRKKKVILVGSGKGEQSLYQLCARMKKQGYGQVSVLRGGLTMWMLSRQPLVGQSIPSTPVNRLSPMEFWWEGNSAHNIVVLDRTQLAFQKEFILAKPMLQMSEKPIKALLSKYYGSAKEKLPATIVLVVNPLMSEFDIQSLQQSLAPVPVVVYQNTHEQFASELAANESIWTARAKGPKQLGCGL